MAKPTDKGKPQLPGSQRPLTPGQRRRQEIQRKVMGQRPRPKHYDNPEDRPVRCFDCANWVDQSMAVATCRLREKNVWYFQMCADFVPRPNAEPVTIPQSPDPQGPVDDPNNEILD